MRPSILLQRDPVLLKARQQSNFRAVKHLVQAQNNIRTVHNRIKILEMNQNKNVKKIYNQLDLIKKIQKIRQISKENDQQILLHRSKLNQEMEIKKHKFVQMNQDHKYKIKQVYQSIQKQKKKNYQIIQQQTQHAQKLIDQHKIQDLKQKQKIHQKVIHQEEKAKQHLLQYINLKQNKIRQIKKVEIINIKCKERNKKKQLKDLTNIQMQLIQKHSESQTAYNQVKNKLDSLLNKVKSQHHIAKNSLRSTVHIKTQSEY